MKQLLLSLMLMGSLALASESYDIEDLYMEADITDAMAEDSYGEVIEVSQVYEKLDITAKLLGTHKVSVTRKGQDFYQIDGTSIYIKTRHCYEYATLEDVILIIDSANGYTKGEIIFPN